MTQSKEFHKAKKFSFTESVDFETGGIVSKNVLKKSTGNISLFAFDAGEGLSEHSAPFDALVQVIEGQAEIIIGGESHHLETRESIIMPADVPHAVKASNAFKMILTMIRG